MRLLHPDVPFAPRRTPVFYGWIVLGAATVGLVMSVPGQTMGVSVFTDPLLEATGLSRLALSNAYLAGTLTSGLLLPSGGRLLDRLGARPTALLAVGLLAATLVLLSQIDRVAGRAAWLLPFASGAAVTWGALVGGFTLLRFSGQGMLTMVSRTMIGKWFDRRRGLASAVSGTVVAFSFAAAPRGLHALVEAQGWRGAWLLLAATVALGMGAVAWLLFRDNPEACGLAMDGAAPDAPRAPEVSSTRAEALRSPAFWALALTLAIHALVYTGFTFHVEDVGAEAGLSPERAVSIFLPLSVVSTSVGALVGWAADRTRIRWLLFGMLTAEALGYAAATQLRTPVGYWLTVLGFGAATGCMGPLSSVALPRYFGRVHLGAIGGAQSMTLVVGSALGPSLLALSETLSGGYRLGLGVCAALPLGAAALNAFARHPRDVPR